MCFLTLSLLVMRICVKFSTVYNDMLVTKELILNCILLAFQLQKSAILLVPDPLNSSVFFHALWLAFVLKTLAVYDMIICQVTINIFFVDWERPLFTGSHSSKDVSMWRLYSVVNMWIKLQTMRRGHLAFQMMSAVVILICGVENFTSYDPYLNLHPPKMGEYRLPTHPWFRFVCFSIIYIFLGEQYRLVNSSKCFNIIIIFIIIPLRPLPISKQLEWIDRSAYILAWSIATALHS